MSVSTEVQRTLVKSPPELWTELSTPEGLARHFGDLGEVRVTKVEPETAVEWEAGDAAGSVQLKQSGWGTKVTLSLTREAPAAEPAAETLPEPAAEPELAEPDPTAEPEPIAEPEPEPVAPELVHVIEVQLEPKPIAEAPTSPGPKPKRGFFARLFKHKRQSTPAAQPLPNPKPEPEPEIEALAQPEPVYPPAPPKPVEHEEPKPDPAADLAAIETQMEQEANELLTGVLDRLGAAHHRPFSRG